MVRTARNTAPGQEPTPSAGRARTSSPASNSAAIASAIAASSISASAGPYPHFFKSQSKKKGAPDVPVGVAVA